jgi:hypothetical protein
MVMMIMMMMIIIISRTHNTIFIISHYLFQSRHKNYLCFFTTTTGAYKMAEKFVEYTDNIYHQFVIYQIITALNVYHTATTSLGW